MKVESVSIDLGIARSVGLLPALVYGVIREKSFLQQDPEIGAEVSVAEMCFILDRERTALHRAIAKLVMSGRLIKMPKKGGSICRYKCA